MTCKCDHIVTEYMKIKSGAQLSWYKNLSLKDSESFIFIFFEQIFNFLEQYFKIFMT